MMKAFFQNNLDVVFFVYGLAFVFMGLAIFIQPRRGSSFKIAKVLKFLGGFGLIHGVNEWLDMWVIVKQGLKDIFWLEILRFSILIVSYYFLFEFGRRLLKISIKNTRIASLFKPWLGVSAVVLILLLGYYSKDWQMASILSRYFLGFPASILTALSIFIYFRNEIRPSLPGLRWNFYFMGGAFLCYGLLGGLVVPPAPFFPASVINTQAFFEATGGIAVQVVRAVCAVIIAVYTVRILAMFNWEAIKDLCKLETERFTDRVTSSAEEMIMVIDKNFRIKWANAKLKSVYGRDILENFCYKVTHRINEPCHPPNDTCPIDETIKTNKPATIIHTHFDASGKSVYAEVSVYPMLDATGMPTGDYVHTSRDVTERIKEQRELEEAYVELKAIQEKLLAAEKMASLGKLSAGIAHEINNPIGFVVSNLNTLEKYISNLLTLLSIYSEVEVAVFKWPGEEAAGLTQKIKDLKKTIDFDYLVADMPKLINETFEGSQRVVRIIRDLKSFSRKDEIEFTDANINELIESALNIVWNEVKYKADVVKEYGELPLVLCHPQQLTQAFMNVIVNAAQAIEKSGTITIKTYLKADKVYIEISDTGLGMSEEVIKMIFEPFFTTKKVGEGTGLGLAIVYGIIQKHKGNVEVKSKAGQGSTFIIILPVKTEKSLPNQNQ
ncbi:MAG: ATP-binding protein [Candidatus Omnitrophota bacterium]|nr:ATP-binding protein [Candidatus Omnitrophota bacterium]